MKVQQTIQNIKISPHLEAVLDQLESITIFDKKFCTKSSKTEEKESKKK